MSVLRRPGTRPSFAAWCSGVALATLALGVVVAFGSREDREAHSFSTHAPPPPLPEPAPVPEPIRMSAVVVHAAAKGWNRHMTAPLPMGEPVPVVVTEYCLNGETRRGRYVRPGIVAADPRWFPLSRYIELYVGAKYLGRFLVDDTGSRIRGAHIDVWVPTCREAVLFGSQRGTAVLVPRRDLQVVQAGARG